jgi:hypothetical protein
MPVFRSSHASAPAVFSLFHSTCHPVYLSSLFRVFLEAEIVFVADLSPGVVVLAAEPEVSAAVSAVAEPEVSAAVSAAAEPEVSAAVSAAAEPSPGAVVLAAEPEAVFVAEPQASVDIAVAFVVLAPVSVAAVEVDSPGRPRFFVFPNADYFASSSSSVEVADQESVHSSTCGRTNYVLCSILSNPDLHQNRSSGHGYNNPNPDCNNVSDTSDLPIGATTSHSRKTCLHQYREQRTHRSCQATLSHPAVPEIRWAAAEKFQCLYSPLPLPEQERQLPTPKAMFQRIAFSFWCLLYA